VPWAVLQFFWRFTSGGAVAQLGARLDGIEEAVGSNPIGSTKFGFPLSESQLGVKEEIPGHMFSTLRSAISICATLIFFGAMCVEATVPATPQESDAVVVKMTTEHQFVPEKITIRVGQTVEWVNDDKTMPHEVTTDPNVASDPSNVSIPEGAEAFDSRLITGGKSFRHQFTVAGIYRYACPPHENDGMLGEVTVTK
jgi:plastocyanin